MVIGTCKVYLTAEWVGSLKEKRTVVKSIINKTRSRFNAAIAEVDKQDVWKSIVLGFACVSNDAGHADSMINHALRFIEKNTDAVIDNIEIEII